MVLVSRKLHFRVLMACQHGHMALLMPQVTSAITVGVFLMAKWGLENSGLEQIRSEQLYF